MRPIDVASMGLKIGPASQDAPLAGAWGKRIMGRTPNAPKGDYDEAQHSHSGGTSSAERAFPTPSPDDVPPLSGVSYADQHANELARGPSNDPFPAASPEDVPPLFGETYADRHAADIARQPFSEVLAGNADWDPLPSEYTYADMHRHEFAENPGQATVIADSTAVE